MNCIKHRRATWRDSTAEKSLTTAERKYAGANQKRLFQK